MHIAVVFELYFKSMLHIVSWDLCFLFSVTYNICLYFFFPLVSLFVHFYYSVLLSHVKISQVIHFLVEWCTH